MDVFSRGEPVRGYQGGMFPVFRIDVTGINLIGCSMRLVIEPRYTPGKAVFTKECMHYENADGSEGYRVQLTTLETRNLCGSYLMHFILSDSTYWVYRNLVVPLEVLPSPQEVST